MGAIQEYKIRNMLHEISKYFFIIISALVGLLFFFRAIKLVFDSKILKHRIFSFPDDKSYRIGYCLCVFVLSIIVIYFNVA